MTVRGFDSARYKREHQDRLAQERLDTREMMNG